MGTHTLAPPVPLGDLGAELTGRLLGELVDCLVLIDGQGVCRRIVPGAAGDALGVWRGAEGVPLDRLFEPHVAGLLLDASRLAIRSGEALPLEFHAGVGSQPHLLSGRMLRVPWEGAHLAAWCQALPRGGADGQPPPARPDSFDLFLQRSSLPIVLVNPHDLTIEEANARAQQFLGATPGALRGTRFSALSTLQPEIFDMASRSALAMGSLGIEIPMATRPSGERQVELHITPTEIHGRPLLLCIMVDVSARDAAIASLRLGKESLALEVRRQTADLLRINNSLLEQIARRQRVEEELRQSEAMFFRLFQLSPSGMLLVCLESELVVKVNKSFLGLTGYAKQEVRGKKVGALPMLPSPHGFDWIARQLAQHGELRQVPQGLTARDGSPRHTLFSAEVVRLERGNHILLAYQDITEIHLAQQQLAESEYRFRSMIENNADIILIIDAQGSASYLSPSVAKHLGYPPNPARQPNVLDYLHPDDHALMLNLLQQMAGGALRRSTHQVRVRHSDGLTRTFEFTANNLLHDPSILGIIVNARDVTEQIRAREEISAALQREQELSRQKSQFISTVSHEFRTPISNISLNIQLLAKYLEQGRTNRAGHSLQRMDNAIKRLAALLNEVSLISRDQGGGLRYTPQEIAAQQLIDHLLDQFSYLILPNVTLEIDPGPPRAIWADVTIISHILSNLLGNAQKFTPNREEVRLSLRVLPSDILTIRVEDRGVGIPEEEIQYLFDPYFRGSNAKHFSGTGLGLSIVKRCVDLHGGDITIHSRLGQGTTVTCSLPLTQ